MPDLLTRYDDFSPEDFEAQYDPRRNRPDYETAVLPDWLMRSAAAKTALGDPLAVRYGEGTRQVMDIYHCNDDFAPVLIYFHGGYWQRGDKSAYAFLARAFVEAGVSMVVVGYDLCPAVTLTRIVEQAREAVAYLWHYGLQLGLDRGNLSVMGHSAGGHLALMAMGTDWDAHPAAPPTNILKACIAISPLSLLEPVRRTESLNAALRMDAAEAEAQSPLLHHPPRTDAPQMLVVGGKETAEFRRQSRLYADAFGTDERRMTMHVVPGVDHFDIINILADPTSDFFAQVMAILPPALRY